MLNKRIKEISEVIEDMKGQDTTIIDLNGRCSWTDFMVVSTATSLNHMRGIARRIKEYLYESGLEVRNSHKKSPDENWLLLDCNDVVINLMTKEAREFYELEKKWAPEGSASYSSSSS